MIYRAEALDVAGVRVVTTADLLALTLRVDEVCHRGVQPPGARVDEQVQSGLERLVKALQLALGLRVMGRAVDMADAKGPQVVLKRPGPSSSRQYGTRTNWTEQNQLLGTQKIH